MAFVNTSSLIYSSPINNRKLHFVYDLCFRFEPSAFINVVELSTHPALRRRGDAAATSLCTSQRRRSYVPNETPNDFSMERHQDVSVIHLQDVILERRNDVSKGRYKGVSSVRLHNVSKESQMKHPVMSQRYVTKTSQWYVSTTSH